MRDVIDDADPEDLEDLTDKEIDALLHEKAVSYGDSDSLASTYYSLIEPFENKYWWFKPYMMMGRSTLAVVVIAFSGETQLVGVNFALFMALRPYSVFGEDLAELLSRLSLCVTVIAGAMIQRGDISSQLGDVILVLTSLSPSRSSS